MQITVFTPTYNRADLLGRLFTSLQKQKFNDFEWIIVDDGSTDNTEEMIGRFLNTERKFKIKYIKQNNKGKHIAINTGAKEAKGELFFIVDSDDYLSDHALAEINREWDHIRDNEKYAGVAPNKCFIGGNSIGNPKYDKIDCSPIDFRYRFHEKGDKAEVIRTSIFKKYPFPETPGELFCPEALFFNRLSAYKLRYFNLDVYFCEYLPGGLTDRIVKLRKDSPVNTCMCYRELCRSNIPFKDKIRAAINFYRFKRYTDSKLESPSESPLINITAKLLSDLIYLILDKKQQ